MKFWPFLLGKDLLEKAEKLDITFLDIEMPELDGIETGKEIYAINPECRIIMATGIVERFKEAFQINAFRFITKSFDSREIEEAVDACIRRRIGLGTVKAYGKRNLYEVRQRDIIYVLAYGSYVELMVHGKRFRKEISMEEVEQMCKRVCESRICLWL